MKHCKLIYETNKLQNLKCFHIEILAKLQHLFHTHTYCKIVKEQDRTFITSLTRVGIVMKSVEQNVVNIVDFF